MTCELAQELILELGPPNAELSSHLAGCEACREFLGFQQALDQQLATAYAAPPLSRDFRAGVQTRIRREKAKQRWATLPPLIAPGAGLITSGICALAAPQMAMFFLSAGVVLSATGYIAHALFDWLTEELGEG